MPHSRGLRKPRLPTQPIMSIDLQRGLNPPRHQCYNTTPSFNGYSTAMAENKPSTDTDIKLQCRTCKKTIYWNDDYPFRPFCSERCQMIDLGEWASENHKIPGAAPDFTDDSHS